MANKFIDNILLIDSSAGVNSQYLGAGSASWPSLHASISAIVLHGNNSNGLLEMVSISDTNNVVVKLSTPDALGGNAILAFDNPLVTPELRCKTLTAGTAWVYFA